MKRIILTLLIVLFVVYNYHSQTSKIDKVITFDMNNIQAIHQGDEVKGYYFMFKKDKVDSETDLYCLCVYDDNFTLVHTRDVEKSNRVYLMEGEFNGEDFCFHFFNAGEKHYEYEIFSSDLASKGKHFVPISKEYAESLEESMKSIYYSRQTTRSNNLIGLPGIGFAIFGNDSKTNKLELTQINDTGTELWKYTCDNTDRNKLETASVIDVSKDKIRIDLRIGKPKAKPEDVSRSFVSIDLKTGKVLATTKIPVLQQAITVSDLTETTDSYSICGIFIKGWTKSGIGMVNISKEGKLLSEYYTFLAGEEAANFISDPEKKKEVSKKLGGPWIIFFMSGKAYAIVQLGSLTTVGDVIIYEIAKGEIKKADFLGMDKIKGVSYSYCFTNFNSNKTSFTSVFIHHDLSKGNEGLNIRSATRKSNGELILDQVRLNINPTEYRVLPAKYGHVAIFEYYKDEKRVNMRLEKLHL